MSYIMLEPNDRNHECTLCGETRSVKYKFIPQRGPEDLFFCNKPQCFCTMMAMEDYEKFSSNIDFDDCNSPLEAMKKLKKAVEMLENIAKMSIRKED